MMRRALCVLFLLVVTAVPLAAKKHKHGYDHRADHCYFEDRDVTIIREYYEPRYRRLPPGLEKKYYRTGHLPPGWEKRIEPLPVAVDRRLVPLPPDYRRGYIDGSVVVYAPRTHAVIDIFAIFRP